MWFSVRHVIHAGRADAGATFSYEERVTVWEAGSFEDAHALARTEAQEAATYLDNAVVLNLFQIFRLFEDPLYGEHTARNGPETFSATHGAEVFSFIRESQLGPNEYLERFFDTGDELESSRARTFRDRPLLADP